MTVADYTFIVNTEQTVAMSSQQHHLYIRTQVLIAVKQGDYNQRYSVYIRWQYTSR